MTLSCTRNQKGNFKVGMRTEKSRLKRSLLSMSAMEKSDLPEVVTKRANKAASAAAEPAERRGSQGNAELQSTVWTRSREAVSRAQARIREAVTRNRQDKLTALLHHVNIEVLRASFFGLKKTAALGVDERTWIEYAGSGRSASLP